MVAVSRHLQRGAAWWVRRYLKLGVFSAANGSLSMYLELGLGVISSRLDVSYRYK